MTSRNFQPCLAHTLTSEGGFVDHPLDPGGATNRGITIGTLSAELGRQATTKEVRDITDEMVTKIYRQRYWDKVRGDDLPDGLDLVAFDGGVNSGPSRGIRWLQRGLRVIADGKIGPQTINAALSGGVAAIQGACAARLGFLEGLRNWSTFGRGWGRRVASVEAEAVAMLTRKRAVVAEQAPKADAAKVARVRDAAGVGAGSGSTGFADIPDFVFYGIIGLAVVIGLILITKSIQHARRADAYRAKAKVMT